MAEASSSSFGRTALAAAWLAGGAAFAALGLWNRSGTEQGRFVRLGVVWALFGVAQFALASRWYPAWADRRVEEWSRIRGALFGAGLALVSLGVVLSGEFLLGFGAGGLLLVAVAVLADR